MTRCFLSDFAATPCYGQLVRAHLVPRQLLKRHGLEHLITDTRTWVAACGGLQGNGGHHGELDAYKLQVPRDRLSSGLEQLMVEVGLDWWLDRRYGPAEIAA